MHKGSKWTNLEIKSDDNSAFLRILKIRVTESFYMLRNENKDNGFIYQFKDEFTAIIF